MIQTLIWAQKDNGLYLWQSKAMIPCPVVTGLWGTAGKLTHQRQPLFFQKVNELFKHQDLF